MQKMFSYSVIAVACAVALAGCSRSRGGDAIDSSKYLTEKPSVKKPQTLPEANKSPKTNKVTPEKKAEGTKPAVKPTEPAKKEVAPPAVKPAEPAKTEVAPPVAKPVEPAKTELSPPVAKPVEPAKTEVAPPVAKPVEPAKTEVSPPVAKPTEPAKTESTPAETKPAVTTMSPFDENLFIASNQGPLVGAISTIKGGKVESQNPLNNGKEKLSELVLNDTRIILFNANDLINGNGMGGFKTLSNQDIAKDTPTDKTLAGYVGGFGEETNYNPEHFRNMRFGVVNLGEETSLFVQGYQTPERASGVVSALNGQHYPMPKGGKFLYDQGYALYGKDGKYESLHAEVVADFTEKHLDVVLKQGAREKLAFSAQIDRNTFSGKQEGVETRGAFYGSLAAEVGGVFYQTEGEDKGKNGVFGAVDKRKIQ